MNPFARHSSHDQRLTRLVQKTRKSKDPTDGLLELLEYLPSVDIEGELATIKVIIRPLIPSPNDSVRILVNRVLYRLLGLLKQPTALQSLQAEWMHRNVMATDQWAGAIFQKYFSVEPVEGEFFGLIRWDELGCLDAFLFLIRNSDKEYKFDPKLIRIESTYELDRIYDILEVVRERLVVRMGRLSVASSGMASTGSSGTGAYSELFDGLFTLVREIRSPLLTSRKYDILLDFYGYADASVYGESAELPARIIKKLIDPPVAPLAGDGRNLLAAEAAGAVDFDSFSVCSVSQLRVLYGRVRDKEAFLLRNIAVKLDILKIYSEFDISDEFITNHFDELRQNIEESVLRLSRDIKASRIAVDDKLLGLLRSIGPLLSGRYRIIAARICGGLLSPADFSNEEVEAVFEDSVRVFPAEYFTAHQFGCSCIPFVSLHPEEAERILPLYPNTPIGDILPFVESPRTLKALILPLSQPEAARIYKELLGQQQQYRNREALWIALYYKLRDLMPRPKLDFELIGEHFFTADFITFLISGSTSDDLSSNTADATRHSLRDFILDYIGNMSISNTVYFTGYNFDDQKQFFYNLEEPADSPAIRVFHVAYRGIKRDAGEQILFYILSILLYNEPDVSADGHSKGLCEFIEGGGAVDIVRRLRDNSFVYERLRRELYKEPAALDPTVLCISRHKAADVILRNCAVSSSYIPLLTASFLSLEALRTAVRLLLQRARGASPEPPPDSSVDSSADASARAGSSVKLSSSPEDTPSGQPSGDVGLGDSLIQQIFTAGTGAPGSITESDLIRFIESDALLLRADLRSARLEIYSGLLDELSERISQSMLNCYSFAKLETNQENSAVFDLLISPLLQASSSLWLLLIRAMHRSNNIYLLLFIEDMLLGMSKTAGADSPLRGVAPLAGYLEVATAQERSLFAFVFPALYKAVRPEGEAAGHLASFIQEEASKKIEGTKIAYSRGSDAYALKMTYIFDSVPYVATITVPKNFPTASPRIEFDFKSAKCPKFYLKLNELLRRTTKFSEIFVQWKVNLDNRFIGYKECLICYYILEPKYRTFADYECRNCHNKYHRRCIFEWMRTSNNRQCPLCRVEMDVWE